MSDSWLVRAAGRAGRAVATVSMAAEAAWIARQMETPRSNRRVFLSIEKGTT